MSMKSLRQNFQYSLLFFYQSFFSFSFGFSSLLLYIFYSDSFHDKGIRALSIFMTVEGVTTRIQKEFGMMHGELTQLQVQFSQLDAWINARLKDLQEGIKSEIRSEELFCRLGAKLKLSTAYHPQTDGQIEILNKCLESYLWCMTGEKPSSWASWLPLAEWWYNTTYHSAIQTTPYEALYGQNPLFTCPTWLELL
ncbi:hypothetical protein E1A91_A05G403100v1 [Gossypium mustelinum]|uniref:Integrase catalytic domain-containing protein n=1 Tax=Gossypium mustelinum TaxID=34275 RepID=A0A5D2ZJD0_GOSMU|nr:hypothetical protein E1A91_A05G403100v1 [Gossypium mustelinum]